MLNNDEGFRWQNCSLEWTQPIESSPDGRARVERELEFQRERIEVLAQQLSKSRESEEELLLQADASAARERLSTELVEKLQAIVDSPIYLSLRYDACRRHERDRIELERVLSRRNSEDATLQLQSIRDRRSLLERELAHSQRRCEDLTRDLNEAVYHRARSARQVFYRSEKIREEMVSIDPEVSVALSNRILRCDICIVISEIFAQYRPWMEFELGVAKSLLKPVIAIIPPSESHCPREIALRCDSVVGWDEDALRRTILALLDWLN